MEKIIYKKSISIILFVWFHFSIAVNFHANSSSFRWIYGHFKFQGFIFEGWSHDFVVEKENEGQLLITKISLPRSLFYIPTSLLGFFQLIYELERKINTAQTYKVTWMLSQDIYRLQWNILLYRANYLRFVYILIQILRIFVLLIRVVQIKHKNQHDVSVIKIYVN